MYSAYTKDQVKLFVGRFGDIIVKAITNQGLFFPAVVAQLTVESEWGTSDLSAKYNNYGGIKNTGSEFSSGSVKLDTTEVSNGREITAHEPFATYDDFNKFMSDYIRVLHLPNYVAAGVYSATDPSAQILAIGKGGYSSRDPQKYLTFAKGRIDACLDLYPWGRIETLAKAPDRPAQNATAKSSAIIQNTINGSLSSLFKVAGGNTAYQPVF